MNLLAKAMNKDYKEQVHPSFVEIIKQMAPNDGIIFKSVFEAQITPVIDLSLKEKGDKTIVDITLHGLLSIHMMRFV